MRLDRDFADDLLIERDATGGAAHDRQQHVIKPFSPTKPTAMQVECYPRHQDEVQPRNRNRSAMRRRLLNAKMARLNVPYWVVDLAGGIEFFFGNKPGQSNCFAGRQS